MKVCSDIFRLLNVNVFGLGGLFLFEEVYVRTILISDGRRSGETVKDDFIISFDDEIS